MQISINIFLPKVKFATKRWMEQIASAQRQHTVPALKSLFQQTVFGWSVKPNFGWSQIRTSDEMIISMYPSGAGADIWNLVNQGAPAHAIYPVQADKLHFQAGYRASTSPGSIMSRRKYRSNPWVFTRYVNHPGFPARDFTQKIADAYQDQFASDMQEAITTIARA